MYPVSTRVLKAITLFGMPHTGPYAEIGKGFEQLGAVLLRYGLNDRTPYWAGVYHDDPGATPPEDLRSHAACLLARGVKPPPEMARIDLPPGKYAVLTYHGSYYGLAEPWKWFREEWMPKSGLTLRKAPALEVYRTMVPKVTEDAQLTEMFLPVE
ncbi:GyrI-like domain-containing protein [Tropicimonas sp. IMCC6043]|uniref:AraC family transcriptional regulator n=1 Tax=Tropicimonas sp. IMCC6043 TaxID=2510645 RepID=UPI0013EA8F8B|nr:GyrI-like domain-containing protein [Tropicimonas sp. IMCC6043]